MIYGNDRERRIIVDLHWNRWLVERGSNGVNRDRVVWITVGRQQLIFDSRNGLQTLCLLIRRRRRIGHGLDSPETSCLRNWRSWM